MDKNEETIKLFTEKESVEKLFNELDKNVAGKEYEELTIGEMLEVAGGAGDVEEEGIVATITLALSGAAAGWIASAAAKCKP